jgi:2-C-methyl-D-erythritol 4-phosphate cytidylyltransferase
MERVGAVIVAAGRSERMGEADKIFADIDGAPLLAHTVTTFQRSPVIDRIVIVLAKGRVGTGIDLVKQYQWTKVISVCAGGARRRDSVSEGLKRLGDVDWVMIHDGARPCLTQDVIERGLEAARDCGSAIPAIPVADTIKVISDDSYVVDTPPRDMLRAAQTPQVFRFDIISAAHRMADDDVTDDARLVERAGHKVKIFRGSNTNIKVTAKEDLIIAEAIIKSRKKRTG